MYDGVPNTLPTRDSLLLPADSLRTVWMAVSPFRLALSSPATPPSRTLARPQSMTWTSPNDPTITFDDFKSRWITPRAWA